MVHNTYQPLLRWVEMYIGFIWLTPSLVILLLPAWTLTHICGHAHGVTGRILINCFVTDIAWRSTKPAWRPNGVAERGQTGPNRAKHPQSVTESPKWEKNSAVNCVLCDAARWIHLQDVARFDGTPVHASRRSLSPFYWAQKRSTNYQLHYVQVSCFFWQQLWQLRTAMYLPLPNVLESYKCSVK